jgi:hypothetical protein
MIRGAAPGPRIKKETNTSPIRINLPSLPLNFRFENLRERSGSLLTISRERIRVKIIKAVGDPVSQSKIVESV